MRSNHNPIILGLTFICFGLSLLISVPKSSHAQDPEAQEQPAQAPPNRAGNQIMDIIKKRVEKKKPMQSRSWHQPSTEENVDAAKSEEKPELEKLSDEEIAENKKIWKKYKTMSDEAKAKKAGTKKDKTPDTEEEQAEAEKTKEEAEKDIKEEPQGGIDIILERYKNAQKNKGKLNSRSYGSID